MLERRKVLAALTAVSAIALPLHHAGAQGRMPSMPGMVMTAQDCIESCWRTHVMCLETERYCLEKGGKYLLPAHLVLLADCAEMCQKTANSLLRRSSQHAAVCIASAQLCDACAQECEAFKDDEAMLLCARTCRQCAEHCRHMSKMAI